MMFLDTSDHPEVRVANTFLWEKLLSDVEGQSI